jgi:thiamine biosynthesis lipoprotein
MIRSLFALLLLSFLCTCDRASEGSVETVTPIFRLQGEAMGTYYKITYIGERIPRLQAQIDSLLDAYNLELSAWEPASKLNAFNASEKGISLEGTDHFIPNFELAQRIHKETDGAYDPTVAPLVRYWGFGMAKERETAVYDRKDVLELLKLVGLNRISLTGDFLHKEPGTELDLNSSAKGYGVDLISGLLTDFGAADHLIDVGGEFRAGGTKCGRDWRVGVRLPDEDRSKVAQAGSLPLSNGRAIATSGNYLDYYKVDGKIFSHTINPKTGLTERNRLLSASVLAPDCATADAYATACMVLGPEGALALVNDRPELEGYFLVRGEDGELETVKSSGLEE